MEARAARKFNSDIERRPHRWFLWPSPDFASLELRTFSGVQIIKKIDWQHSSFEGKLRHKHLNCAGHPALGRNVGPVNAEIWPQYSAMAVFHVAHLRLSAPSLSFSFACELFHSS
jgi:hypothetical protein